LVIFFSGESSCLSLLCDAPGFCEGTLLSLDDETSQQACQVIELYYMYLDIWIESLSENYQFLILLISGIWSEMCSKLYTIGLWIIMHLDTFNPLTIYYLYCSDLRESQSQSRKDLEFYSRLAIGSKNLGSLGVPKGPEWYIGTQETLLYLLQFPVKWAV
jgi:hypothetical protein